MVNLFERRAVLAAAASLIYAASMPSSAQSNYPTKPIRLIVPFPPGGSADETARTIGQALSQVLGQPVIMENRAGADSVVAGDVVAKSLPDGYTLLFGTATGLTAAPVLHKAVPYDAINGFTPIARVGTFVHILLVHESVPVKTLAELVAYARANPGKLSYGTGTGTAIFATAQLARQTGLNMVHVPYKGDAPMMLDAVPGRVQVMFGVGGPWLPHVSSGRLRALAVLLPNRSPLLPDVPTMAEAGYPEVTVTPWAGLLGPAGLPRTVVERLNSAVVTALASQDVQDRLNRQAFNPGGSSPNELGVFMKEQLRVWQSVAREIGLTPE